MSQTSYIDFCLYGQDFIPSEIIETLRKYGWTDNDHGSNTYLSMTNNGEFTWERTPLMDRKDVLNLLSEKEKREEAIGIVLLWDDTGIGGSFVFDKKKRRVSVSLMVNRKVLERYPVTDISWYLDRLVPPLLQKGYSLESIQWTDSV
jgi:hypothetical protein